MKETSDNMGRMFFILLITVYQCQLAYSLYTETQPSQPGDLEVLETRSYPPCQCQQPSPQYQSYPPLYQNNYPPSYQIYSPLCQTCQTITQTCDASPNSQILIQPNAPPCQTCQTSTQPCQASQSGTQSSKDSQNVVENRQSLTSPYQTLPLGQTAQQPINSPSVTQPCQCKNPSSQTITASYQTQPSQTFTPPPQSHPSYQTITQTSQTISPSSQSIATYETVPQPSESIVYQTITPSCQISPNGQTTQCQCPQCQQSCKLPLLPPIPLPTPLPQPKAESSTILITDCTPEVCQNLVNTLNLMAVCNVLQNTQGGKDVALQLAKPAINQLLSSPTFSCGCVNPVYSSDLNSLVPPYSLCGIPSVSSVPTIFSNLLSPLPTFSPSLSSFPTVSPILQNNGDLFSLDSLLSLTGGVNYVNNVPLVAPSNLCSFY